MTGSNPPVTVRSDGMDDLRQSIGDVYQNPQAKAPEASTGLQEHLAPGYWAKAFAEQDQRDAETWAATMRTAIATDPGVAAEADKLSRGLNLPLGDAQQDIGFLRAVSVLHRMREDRIESTNPVLYKSMGGLEFARKAWNDYEHLSNTERWGQAFRRGLLTSARGKAATRLAMGDTSAAPEFESIERELAALGPTAGPFSNAVEILGQWGANLPRALATGAASAGAAAGTAALFSLPTPIPDEAIAVPAAALWGFKAGFSMQYAADVVATEGGNAYADMIAAGYDPARARLSAAGVGLVNAVLEIGGMGLATAPLRQAVKGQVMRLAGRELAAGASSGFLRGFAGAYATAIGSETATEVMQELVTIAGETMAARPGDKDLSPEGVAARLWEVASKTAQGMAFLGLPGAVGGGMRARVVADLNKQAQDALKAGGAIADRSNLQAKDPTAFGEFAGAVLRQGANNPEAHIDALALRDLLAKVDAAGAATGELRKSTADVLEGILPGFKEELESAIESGGDMSFAVADLVSRIRGEAPEFAVALEDSGLLRFDPDAKAEGKTAEGTQEAEKQAATADTGTDEAAKFYEELRAVETEAAQSLVAAGGQRVSPTQARATARVYSAAIEQVAQAEKISPAEVAKAYGVAFQPVETTGRGEFDPAQMVILMGQASDATTGLHEVTHWFTEVADRLDRQGSAYGKEQFGRLLTRWNLTREQWDGMDLAARRPFLEDISYNAEEYFASGQAPSAELKGLFDKLRSFIVNVYRNVRAMLVAGYRDETGQDLKPISPELRDFFDRMLASEQAIEIERATREGAARLSDEAAKAIGIGGEELAEIRRLEQDQFDEAKAKLTSESLRGARFFQAGRRNVEADVKRKLRDSQKRIRAEVEKELADSPVYQALDFLRNGKIEVENAESGKKEQVSARLDTDAVQAILGPDFDKLPSGLTRKGGVNPDHFAQQFGFDTGEAMLRAIMAAPSMEDAATERTASRMAAEEPLANPAEFKRVVEEALHGKTATRLASTILRAMLKGIGATVTGIEAQAREAARITLLRTPVGRITVRAMAAAELRAAMARDKALKSGKIEEAIDAQRRYLVQHYMTREAAKVEREVERGLRSVSDRYGKADADIISGRRNLDIVNAVRVILGKFDLFNEQRAKRAEAALSEMQTHSPSGYQQLAVRIYQSTQDAKPWRTLPLDRFKTLMAEADGAWSEAKRSEQVRIAGELRAVGEVQAEMEGQTIDLFGGGTVTGLTMGKTDQAPSPNGFESVLASLTRLEAWTVKMDGGKLNGPWHRNAYQPLKDATVAMELEMAQHSVWIRDHLAKFDDLAGPGIDLQQFLGQGRRAVFKTRADLIGALLQMGTESNFRNFILGNRLGEQQNGVLVTRWADALQHAADRGRLSKRDFDLVQDVWNYIRDNLKDRLFATTREVWGFYPEAVEAMAFDTPFGRYPGGYFPSKVDKSPGSGSRITEQRAAEAIRDGRQEFVNANRSVPRGVTITRQQEAVQPRITDLNVLEQHISEVLQIIHVQPALSDSTRLFGGRQNTMAATLSQVQPFAERNIIMPARERLARNSIVAPSDSLIASIAGWLKQSASIYFLGFNPRNAAQQFTGLANAVPLVGFRRLFDTLLEHGFSPKQAIAKIDAASDAMRNRWSRDQQLMAQDIQRMLNPSKMRVVREEATAAAFFLQRYAQMATDAAVWMAAKAKATEEGKAEADAIKEADATVRLTQGEKTPLDVPRALSGDAVKQLLTQFADYPNTVLNQNIAAPVGKRFATFAWTLIVPTMASSMLAIAFAFGNIGKGSRDDEDYAERMVKHLLGDQVRGILGVIPVGGGLAGSALNRLFGLTNDPGGMRNQPFAGWTMVEAIARTLSGEAKPADALATVMAGLGIPARPVVNVVRYAGKDESADADWIDYVRVLLNGR